MYRCFQLGQTGARRSAKPSALALCAIAADEKTAEAAALVVATHFGCERRERGGGCRVGDGAQSGGVNAGRKIFERSVPSKGDRAAPGDDSLDFGVVHENLKVGMLREECFEVLTADVAVVVVLRPEVSERCARLHPAVGPFVGRKERET